jgi:hypothetical protein
VRFHNQATADRKREKTIPMKLKGVVPELGTEPQGSSVPDKVGSKLTRDTVTHGHGDICSAHP